MCSIYDKIIFDIEIELLTLRMTSNHQNNTIDGLKEVPDGITLVPSVIC